MEPGDSRAWGMGALSRATLGDTDRAVEWIERAASIAGEDSAAMYNFGCLYSRLDMHDKALELLERSIDLGFAHLDWIDNDPDWDELRDNPGFVAAVARIT